VKKRGFSVARSHHTRPEKYTKSLPKEPQNIIIAERPFKVLLTRIEKVWKLMIMAGTSSHFSRNDPRLFGIREVGKTILQFQTRSGMRRVKNSCGWEDRSPFHTSGPPAKRKSMISLLRDLLHKGNRRFPYCGTSCSKEIDDFLLRDVLQQGNE